MISTSPAVFADGPPGTDIDSIAITTAAPRLVFTLTGSTVEIAGDVVSASHADVLSRLVAEHFPDRTIDASLEPAPVADIDWQVLTLSAVFVLAETSAGRLVLAPDSLELSGIVAGRTDLLETRINRVASAAGTRFSSQVSLHDLDRSMSADRACARMFRALGTSDIRFQFGPHGQLRR